MTGRPWQDWVLMVGQFVIAASMIPTVVGDAKPAIETAFLTSGVAWVITGTFLSWRAWLSGLGAGTLAALWTVVAIQVVTA